MTDLVTERMGLPCLPTTCFFSKRREKLTGIHCELDIQGNYLFEEILNSVTHGIGCLAALLGTALLMGEAMKEEKASRSSFCCSITSRNY